METTTRSRASRAETIVHALREHVRSQPDKVAVRFVDDDDGGQLTYRELDARARAVASELAARGMRGRPVVLAFRPGLAFVAAFLGALYARAAAVPVALPRLGVRAGAEMKRLGAILEHAEPGAVLTEAMLVPFYRAASQQGHLPTLPNLIATEELGGADETILRLPTSADLAVIQYTSGSTSPPRGVRVTHANVVSNVEMIARTYGADASSVFGGWLPHFHDMGLFGQLCTPLFLGVPTVLSSPLRFLRRPVSWLRMITEHGITITGGPSFAYARCLRAVKDADLESLDLSSLRVAVDGSEPVQARTHRRFAERFAPAGFDAAAFTPSYGLAEATVFVTGVAPDAPARTLTVSLRALGDGVVQKAGRGEPSAELISCGRPAPGCAIRIVDPQTGLLCGDGRVGEVWVTGPQVADGYHRDPEATQRTFGARVPGDARAWLRTGDLGFVDGRELFIAGRIKEVIIVRGKNLYPHDLEQVVAAALDVPALRVAVAEAPGAGALDVVVEGLEPARVASARDVVASALFEAHGVALDRLVRVDRGTLPRTTSGKKQRHKLAAIVQQHTGWHGGGAR